MDFGSLGKNSDYVEEYSPALLFPLSRALAREKLKLTELPFEGVDLWTGFELSWLTPTGKPAVALADFSFPCTSPFLIESKSFKLYLNSFNQTVFKSASEVEALLKHDLSEAVSSDVEVYLRPLHHASIATPPGESLDALAVETSTYEVCPDFLSVGKERVQERLYSDLLKSNCLATGQPDWGTLLIHYVGPKIHREGLLKYIISFRRHAGFAEHCVEEIFLALLSRCFPDKLTVMACYTRRGGLAINPFRSNFEKPPETIRFLRQ